MQASASLLFLLFFVNVSLNNSFRAGFFRQAIGGLGLSTTTTTTKTTTSTATTTLSQWMVPPSPSREYDARAGQRKPPAPQAPINDFIKCPTVRLIAPGNETDEDGMMNEIMLGIFSLADAQKKADEMDLDLVLINDKGDPPVCKIIDYGKYKYSQEKKKKENAKKQVKSEIKEVKMSYKIDDHDFDVRMRAVQRFLGDGDRVKVVVQFKGREMQHKELGRDLLLKIFKPLEDVAVMESPPKV